MSELKCPFCQQELESVLQLAGAGGLVEEAYLLCSKCNIRGERKLWQELIRTKELLEIEDAEHSMCHTQMLKTTEKLERTRKALDVAVDALKPAHEYYQNCVIREKQPQEINWYYAAMNMDDDIFKALEQITATLENQNGNC